MLPIQYLHLILTIQWSTRKEKYMVTFITITCNRLHYILQSTKTCEEIKLQYQLQTKFLTHYGVINALPQE